MDGKLIMMFELVYILSSTKILQKSNQLIHFWRQYFVCTISLLHKIVFQSQYLLWVGIWRVKSSATGTAADFLCHIKKRISDNGFFIVIGIWQQIFRLTSIPLIYFINNHQQIRANFWTIRRPESFVVNHFSFLSSMVSPLLYIYLFSFSFFSR